MSLLFALFILKPKLYIKYNYINVAYAFDSQYYYIAHVSMKSIMINQDFDTFIIFHILISEITNKIKTIIGKICIEHKNCKIRYYLLKRKFEEFCTKGYTKWTKTIFYRIFLQNVLINEKKVLYLDCDTIVYKDLKEIYNYNIERYYYAGMLQKKSANINGYKIKNYINSGVILINLENLRKDNIFSYILKYLRKNNKKLLFPDQDAINAVCHRKNAILPRKFVTIAYCSLNSINKADIEKINSYKDPYIIHYIIYGKPWKRLIKEKNYICFDPISRFYEYARKSSYYYEILENFKIKIKL